MALDTKKAFRRGGKKHYAELALKSVESRIKRHIDVEVICDTDRQTAIPARKRETDAGYDVCTPIAIRLMPNQSIEIPLGIRLNCPKGYFFETRGRSSISGIEVETTDYIIDATYTGEITIKLFNRSGQLFRAEPGDRIAQFIFLPQIHVTFIPVEKFTVIEGARGTAGWGSSGRKTFTSEPNQK